MNKDINDAFLRLARRAEANERATLVQTFVDVGALFTLLASPDHQILYGRRGTGKTHALLTLAESRAAKGDAAIYLDMRTVGSTGGIYSDPSLPTTERATRLLMDTLGAIHTGLLEFSVQHAEKVNLSVAGPLLDQLADAITEVRVVGTATEEAASSDSRSQERVDAHGLKATLSEVALTADSTVRDERSVQDDYRRATTGVARHRVHFGAVGSLLRSITSTFSPNRTWLLLDEWSVVPIDLQPILADLLRRSVLPVTGVSVKIGAIEQRSLFSIPGTGGDYLGVELGADIAADVNLDDFMVFENDAARATTFFQELLFRHYQSVVTDGDRASAVKSSSELVRLAFTQRNTFEEYVRASEGVPRDAINILSLAAQRAFADSISTDILRGAAKTWYQRDKHAAVSASPNARDFLHWIIEQVIAHRRARAFLLRSDIRHPLVDTLFDARVLHLLKRNIAAHDQAGVRFDVYKIDFGCYVDLLTTARAPAGLLPAGDADNADGGYVDVPPDDYRAIRRAILDPARFQSATTETQQGLRAD